MQLCGFTVFAVHCGKMHAKIKYCRDKVFPCLYDFQHMICTGSIPDPQSLVPYFKVEINPIPEFSQCNF